MVACSKCLGNLQHCNYTYTGDVNVISTMINNVQTMCTEDCLQGFNDTTSCLKINNCEYKSWITAWNYRCVNDGKDYCKISQAGNWMGQGIHSIQDYYNKDNVKETCNDCTRKLVAMEKINDQPGNGFYETYENQVEFHCGTNFIKSSNSSVDKNHLTGIIQENAIAHKVDSSVMWLYGLILGIFLIFIIISVFLVATKKQSKNKTSFMKNTNSVSAFYKTEDTVLPSTRSSVSHSSSYEVNEVYEEYYPK